MTTLLYATIMSVRLAFKPNVDFSVWWSILEAAPYRAAYVADAHRAQ